MVAFWTHKIHVFRLKVGIKGRHFPWKHYFHWLSGIIMLLTAVLSETTPFFSLFRLFHIATLNVAWMWKSSARCLNIARVEPKFSNDSQRPSENVGFVWTIRIDLIHIWMKVTRICEISAVERWLLTSIFSCQIQRVISALICGNHLFQPVGSLHTPYVFFVYRFVY